MSQEAKEVVLTQEGFEKLEKELQEYKTIRRKENSERLKEAISHGDISENSEYDDAKNEQAFIEGHIIDLERMLANVVIIDEAEVVTDAVSLGSTVVLEDVEFGDSNEYTIVGAAEADPVKSRISNESPVGAAAIGHKVGDVFDVDCPVGKVQYKIIEIK